MDFTSKNRHGISLDLTSSRVETLYEGLSSGKTFYWRVLWVSKLFVTEQLETLNSSPLEFMSLHFRLRWWWWWWGGGGGGEVVLNLELYAIFCLDYRTPNLNPSNRPFNYFCYGAACSEVEIDCLTGDHQVRGLQSLTHTCEPA